MGKAKKSIATSMLVALCSSVSTKRYLTASCGTYPNKMSDLFQCQFPTLSNLCSSKKIGKANKQSTGRKYKVLFVPIAVVDPSLRPNSTIALY